VRHCESFIRDRRHLKLREHSQTTITDYLNRLLSDVQKPAWQKRQVIHAIQLLFKTIRSPVYQSIDWEYWKSSTLELEKEHDTHYRKRFPVPTKEIPLAKDKNSCFNKNIAMAIENTRIAIRRLNYSSRTEKSYVDWLDRFFRYHKNISPDDLTENHIVSFLEYLAVQREVSPSTQKSDSMPLYFSLKKCSE
jgi:hypothetical protein